MTKLTVPAKDYTVCDRCNCKVEGAFVMNARIDVSRKSRQGPYCTLSQEPERKLDLCDECIESFEDWAKNIATAPKE